MLTALPLINLLVSWNEQICLPESLSGLEQLMQQLEAQVNALLQQFLTYGNGAWWVLLLNLLVLAVLPAPSPHCCASFVGDPNLPFREGAGGCLSTLNPQRSTLSLGDGFHLLVHTFSVLRLHTATAVMRVVRLRAAVERKYPLQHDHARHQQRVVGAAVLLGYIRVGYDAGAA